MDCAIEVSGLRKRYGDREVLCGVSLSARRGSVLGLLGPNGAGKTTIVRALATLLTPDGGSATVAGFDVVRQPGEVRKRMALAGQYAALDEALTGTENLVLLGRLLRLGRQRARQRAAELLEQFGLGDAAGRPVRTYSGGMRRRLDIASCLVSQPVVLFLDEPTTGLDPASRLALWATVRELVSGGVTVLLTTQYLEEADQLADQVVVLSTGKVIADGTPAELKRKVGQERLELTVEPHAVVAASSALLSIAAEPPEADPATGIVSLRLSGSLSGMDGIAAAAAALRESRVAVTDFALRRPTLDDVFLGLVGKPGP
ncbi:ATP-binding cassette domain-containing protein [Amycolatopsis sp. cg13]|uniref:ATP-binding cassette domain-containing protein n=1 Tax=Amycolatopsis sp. cg13 TaxID=3238807 RepID=UPI003525117A